MITEHTPFRPGEVLFFSGEPAAVRMMAALLGIRDGDREEALPCLAVCDGDDPAQCAALEKSPLARVPVLFYTTDPDRFTPPGSAGTHLVLRRPFLFTEFRRAAARLRRNGHAPDVPDAADAPAVHAETAKLIRVENQTAVWNNVRVPLSPCEAGVLTALIQAYPNPASRERLESVFTRNGSNSVSVYVSYLRKKLAVIPAFRTVLSVKGGGFVLLMHPFPKQNND